MRAGLAAFVAAATALGLCGCVPPEPPPQEPSTALPTPEPLGRRAAALAPAASSADVPNEKVDAAVVAMARRVARARRLPLKRAIRNRVIERDQIVVHVKAHAERELPRDVLAHQGEALAALELVPPRFDFVAGVFALLSGRIAGFYDPDDATMYLIDDLEEEEAEETLAHELVHALQDQHFGLGPLLKYVPGESDRLAAAHSLAEGDAMSAMLDATMGSAFAVDEDFLRFAFQVSTLFSTTGAQTPPVLQQSLTASYSDGFRFVQALRSKGDWPLVDLAWQRLPASTEQVLHPEKYHAREPPIRLAPPEPAALGAGWKRVLDDVMGEQGLRIALEEWSSRRRAAPAAAGWGGDRYVVARNDAAPGRPAFAVAWHIRMDTAADAKEVAQVLEDRFGTQCKERPELGSFTWSHADRDLCIVGGAYTRSGRVPAPAGACPAAEAWARAILASK